MFLTHLSGLQSKMWLCYQYWVVFANHGYVKFVHFICIISTFLEYGSYYLQITCIWADTFFFNSRKRWWWRCDSHQDGCHHYPFPASTDRTVATPSIFTLMLSCCLHHKLWPFTSTRLRRTVRKVLSKILNNYIFFTEFKKEFKPTLQNVQNIVKTSVKDTPSTAITEILSK